MIRRENIRAARWKFRFSSRIAVAGSVRRISGVDCLEALNITQPKQVAAMHTRMMRAGARLIFTNTARAAPQLLDRYRMHDEAFAISFLAANIACRAVRETPGGLKRVAVVGDVRLPRRLPGHGYLTGAEVEAAAAAMTSAQVAGGVNAVYLVASNHPAHMAAAFSGLRAGMAEAGRTVPVFATVREDLREAEEDPATATRKSLSTAVLAHSLGAVALGIETGTDVDLTIARLSELAAHVDTDLFLAPGGSEETARKCLADAAIGPRLIFVGADQPSEAWRLSRFVPATLTASSIRRAANENIAASAATTAPILGVAR
jgi:methionine synthase I (cobalamin-dependent)